MNIKVVGGGYVGLAVGIMLAENNFVEIVDVDEKKIDLINRKVAPIADIEIKKKLPEFGNNLRAIHVKNVKYQEADWIFIAVPTNFDEERNMFDTSQIEKTISQILSQNEQAKIVIKSTIPIGYTDEIKKKYKIENLIFCPEFLREGSALRDSYYPQRIVLGVDISKKEGKELSEELSRMLRRNIKKAGVPVLIMSFEEAETVKLLSNSYLAMRIAFFNEVDTYAETRGLDCKRIIEGICNDNRIGNYYNNPSFGYGGYCLPKDSKQMEREYETKGIPQALFKAIIESNAKRKKYISEKILSYKSKRIGIYRLCMKKGSDNFREAAVIEIIKTLKEKGEEVCIYEPLLPGNTIDNIVVYKKFSDFLENVDLIVANRITEEIRTCRKKVYSRDIFEIS